MPMHKYTQTHTHKWICTHTCSGIRMSETQQRASLLGRTLAHRAGSGCLTLTFRGLPLSPYRCTTFRDKVFPWKSSLPGPSWAKGEENGLDVVLSAQRVRRRPNKWYLRMWYGASWEWSWIVEGTLFWWFPLQLREPWVSLETKMGGM